MPSTAPYGSWKSPITPLVATTSAGHAQQMGSVRKTGDWLTWLEPRPAEQGRMVIVGISLASPGGAARDITPPGFNVRDTVNEYGGAPYWVHGETIFFTHYDDQRIYRQPITGGAPEPITPEPDLRRGLRYADGVVTGDGKWIICVREQHHERGEADTGLVALPANGPAGPGSAGEARIIAEGHNFYSNPRISPDGKSLAYLCWDHPNMPWDGAELRVADLAPDCSLTSTRVIAGGKNISIFQPEWAPDGRLTYSSDETGWWNLYVTAAGHTDPLTSGEVNIGGPAWQFGYSVYTFLSGGRIACLAGVDGGERLCILTPGGELEPLSLPPEFKTFYYPALAGDGQDTLYFAAGGPTRPSAIAGYNVSSGELTILRESMTLPFDRAYLSKPRHISFPTTPARPGSGGDVAHALYYPPTNPDYQAPPGELPPLLVQSHGGPTASAPLYLSLLYQYYTSRGFAVVDVDYRGSTGYGRAYWKKLYGQWGVIDVDDCIAAAQYLVGEGLADPNRMAISGGSAGGYCTLCALTFHDVFQAGSSWYGIGDMETLVTDGHKFESRYCDMLVAGTYPAPKELLRERSPIHYTDRLSAPMILLQGLEDTVVPPNQSEEMARALDAKGLPYALLEFEGEGHGFRKTETLIRCMEAETYFFSKVFKFEPADKIEPVEIHNLE